MNADNYCIIQMQFEREVTAILLWITNIPRVSFLGEPVYKSSLHYLIFFMQDKNAFTHFKMIMKQLLLPQRKILIKTMLDLQHLRSDRISIISIKHHTSSHSISYYFTPCGKFFFHIPVIFTFHCLVYLPEYIQHHTITCIRLKLMSISSHSHLKV